MKVEEDHSQERRQDINLGEEPPGISLNVRCLQHALMTWKGQIQGRREREGGRKRGEKLSMFDSGEVA